MFENAKQIQSAFITDGWSKSINMEELSLNDAEKIGAFSIIQKMKSGHKYFRMLFSENVYDENGKLVLYGKLTVNKKIGEQYSG